MVGGRGGAMVMVQGGPPGRSPMGAMHAEWLLEPRIVFFFLNIIQAEEFTTDHVKYIFITL